MLINFNPQEMALMREYAKEYKKQTGDEEYSQNYVMTLLTAKYEVNLDKDLKKIFDKKVRDYEEQQAQEGKLRISQ